ncbi:MAG TPA: hypothetical protein VK582_04460 [Pyrinomonadaceae bacterium]|nr:hypothetical protein [Pyrinomonadaceae bacterium]
MATTHFPRLTAWHVRNALKWIDPLDLEGLEYVRIIDYKPDDPDVSKVPPYLAGFLYCGSYVKKKGKRPASILLYTHDLYFGIPRLLAPSPMAGLIIASTLAHEVGHHAIETRGYNSKSAAKTKLNSLVDSKKERAATAYASEVVNKLLNSWYFRCGRLLARVCSYYFFKIGNKAHWRGNFKRAAALEFRAYMINTDNVDAWQAYLQDRAAIVSKTSSALTDAERLWIFHRRVATDQTTESEESSKAST